VPTPVCGAHAATSEKCGLPGLRATNNRLPPLLFASAQSIQALTCLSDTYLREYALASASLWKKFCSFIRFDTFS
jgi:hypothetical protein